VQLYCAPTVDTRQAVSFADVDLDVLDGAYLDLDVVGHYARPDLFRLTTPGLPPRAHHA